MTLEVEKTGLMRGKRHIFVYEGYEGVVNCDAARPEASVVRFSIEAASLVSKDTWVGASDLKKIEKEALENMMAASRYPRLEFAASAVRRLTNGSFQVEGSVKIRDVSKPVVLAVSLAPQPDGVLRFEGMAKLKLTDSGLKPPSAALGAVGTKDEMDFRFGLVLQR